MRSDLEDLKSRALAATDRGRLRDSVRYYQRALELDPTDVQVCNNLGCILLELDRAHEAVSVFSSLKGEGNSEFKGNLGYALMTQGDLHQSEVVFRELTDKDPENASARNHLGMVLIRRGRYPEAMEELHRVVREYPNMVEAWNNLGAAYQRCSRMEEASSFFERALQVDPYNADAHNNLGCVLRECGELEEATEELQLASTLEPQNPAIHLNLALCYQRDSQLKKSIVHFRHNLLYGKQNSAEFADIHQLLRALEDQVDELIKENKKNV